MIPMQQSTATRLIDDPRSLTSEDRSAILSTLDAIRAGELAAAHRGESIGRLHALKARRAQAVASIDAMIDQGERERHALDRAVARGANARAAILAFAPEAERERLAVARSTLDIARARTRLREAEHLALQSTFETPADAALENAGRLVRAALDDEAAQYAQVEQAESDAIQAVRDIASGCAPISIAAAIDAANA